MKSNIGIASDSQITWMILAVLIPAMSGCAKPSPKLKSGEFIAVAYLKSLDKTKSPRIAAKSGRPQSIKVESVGGGISIQTILDFNEGGAKYFLSDKGVVSLLEGVGGPPEIHIIDSITLEIGSHAQPKRQFNYSGNPNRDFLEMVLSGKYQGVSGEVIEFTGDGSMIINGRKSKLALGLYYPPTFARDYFVADSSEFSFAWTTDTLRIYSISGGSLFEDGQLDSIPKFTLLPVPKSK